MSETVCDICGGEGWVCENHSMVGVKIVVEEQVRLVSAMSQILRGSMSDMRELNSANTTSAV